MDSQRTDALMSEKELYDLSNMAHEILKTNLSEGIEHIIIEIEVTDGKQSIKKRIQIYITGGKQSIKKRIQIYITKYTRYIKREKINSIVGVAGLIIGIISLIVGVIGVILAF